MQVVVNAEKVELPPGETVAALLARLMLDAHPCAVEVNQDLVPKRSHAQKELVEGDVIEIVTLVGGG
jgi:thiamine biosynthesis protein ThiS